MYCMPQLATLPMIIVYTLGCHNSIWTFLLGLSFERGIAWHQYYAALFMAAGAYHGIIATRLESYRVYYMVTGMLLPSATLARIPRGQRAPLIHYRFGRCSCCLVRWAWCRMAGTLGDTHVRARTHAH
jgi:hypothetical protein